MDDLMYASRQIRLFSRLNSNLKMNIPISSSEMGMLIYLVSVDGEKTPIAVSKYFNVSKSMATNMATSLFKKGYINKNKGKNDGRSVYLEPTEKARELVEKTQKEYFGLLSKIIQGIGEKNFERLVSLIELANKFIVGENNDE